MAFSEHSLALTCICEACYASFFQDQTFTCLTEHELVLIIKSKIKNEFAYPTDALTVFYSASDIH